eukprot:scaffold2470_cov158-Ochromonas_danica.AAC.1
MDETLFPALVTVIAIGVGVFLQFSYLLLLLFCSAAPPVRTVFAPRQSSAYDGIQDISTALPRSKLVVDLFDKVVEGNSRFVHLGGSPAASGKTSLLQLFEQYCAGRGVTCIYVSMLLEDFRAVLREKTGINPSTWKLDPTNEKGECV